MPTGFEDTSWYHNETPSFDKVQPDGTVLRLWVDYADRAMSRLTDEVPYLRFALACYTGEDEWIANLGLTQTRAGGTSGRRGSLATPSTSAC